MFAQLLSSDGILLVCVQGCYFLICPRVDVSITAIWAPEWDRNCASQPRNGELAVTVTHSVLLAREYSAAATGVLAMIYANSNDGGHDLGCASHTPSFGTLVAARLHRHARGCMHETLQDRSGGNIIIPSRTDVFITKPLMLLKDYYNYVT